MPTKGGKKTARDVLAENLSALMAAREDVNSGPKLAAKSGASQKTISNILKKRHDPKLSTVEQIARVFGLEAHQLLCVNAPEDNFLLVCRAYNETDERGRQYLNATAEALLGKPNRQARSTG